jgi:hypothetical protein
MVSKRKFPEDLHPETEERFERLLRAIAKLVFGKPKEENQKKKIEHQMRSVAKIVPMFKLP